LTSGASAIATGNAHTCALTTTSLLKCWGMNSDGQLGNGSLTSSTTPLIVTFPSATDYTYGNSSHKHAVTALNRANSLCVTHCSIHLMQVHAALPLVMKPS